MYDLPVAEFAGQYKGIGSLSAESEKGKIARLSGEVTAAGFTGLRMDCLAPAFLYLIQCQS